MKQRGVTDFPSVKNKLLLTMDQPHSPVLHGSSPSFQIHPSPRSSPWSLESSQLCASFGFSQVPLPSAWNTPPSPARLRLTFQPASSAVLRTALVWRTCRPGLPRRPLLRDEPESAGSSLLHPRGSASAMGPRSAPDSPTTASWEGRGLPIEFITNGQ